ncbi:hypothetical protein ABIF66_010059 [Bradyrhizobium japonicum]
MLRSKPQPIRNKLGLIDRTQVCLELWRNLGDDGVRKAAYRGG